MRKNRKKASLGKKKNNKKGVRRKKKKKKGVRRKKKKKKGINHNKEWEENYDVCFSLWGFFSKRRTFFRKEKKEEKRRRKSSTRKKKRKSWMTPMFSCYIFKLGITCHSLSFLPFFFFLSISLTEKKADEKTATVRTTWIESKRESGEEERGEEERGEEEREEMVKNCVSVFWFANNAAQENSGTFFSLTLSLLFLFFFLSLSCSFFFSLSCCNLFACQLFYSFLTSQRKIFRFLEIFYRLFFWEEKNFSKVSNLLE